jgi:hypothetical protein
LQTVTPSTENTATFGVVISACCRMSVMNPPERSQVKPGIRHFRKNRFYLFFLVISVLGIVIKIMMQNIRIMAKNGRKMAFSINDDNI